MYLHIGNNKNIRERHIIGIFDADTATVASTTRKFLSGAEKKGLVEFSTEEVPKSFVLYQDSEKCKICFSQLSTTALLGRSGNEQN